MLSNGFNCSSSASIAFKAQASLFCVSKIANKTILLEAKSHSCFITGTEDFVQPLGGPWKAQLHKLSRRAFFDCEKCIPSLSLSITTTLRSPTTLLLCTKARFLVFMWQTWNLIIFPRFPGPQGAQGWVQSRSCIKTILL